MVVQGGRAREKEVGRKNYRQLEGGRKRYGQIGRREDEREGDGEGKSGIKPSK